MKKQSQKSRFVTAARELGCEEGEATFDSALKRISSVKPKAAPKKKPRKSKT